jgi:osmotically-inducible protein OsmY
MSDTTLAPLGSTLIANVSRDGVVTLKGNVSSPSEQQRVSDSISSLPGVRGIDNQLSVGSFRGGGTVNLQ